MYSYKSTYCNIIYILVNNCFFFHLHRVLFVAVWRIAKRIAWMCSLWPAMNTSNHRCRRAVDRHNTSNSSSNNNLVYHKVVAPSKHNRLHFRLDYSVTWTNLVPPSYPYSGQTLRPSKIVSEDNTPTQCVTESRHSSHTYIYTQICNFNAGAHPKHYTSMHTHTYIVDFLIKNKTHERPTPRRGTQHNI